MAEFKLERFKYNWRGNWNAGTSYKRDDVVRINGRSYVCVVTHTASSAFRTDLNAILPGSIPPQPQPRWVVMTSGKSFIGNYQANVNYNLGDIVLYDGILWLCVVPHFSSGAPSEASNWQTFASGIAFVGDWEQARTYGPGAVVKYNGISYKCIEPHVSGTLLEDNLSSWAVFKDGDEFVGDWEPSTNYRKNDLVRYGGAVYKATTTHISDPQVLTTNVFSLVFPGSQYEREWSSSTYYNEGDLVRYNGFVYYAVNNNNNSIPFIDSDAGSSDWILISRSYNYVGDWAIDGRYNPGDIVLRGGNLYLALRELNGNQQDGSSADYLDDSTWELLVPGKSWQGNWAAGNLYSINDIVYYKGSAFRCNFEHESTVRNFPGDNGNGFDYWDILIQSGQPGSLQSKGDLITYGSSRELNGVEDTSTLGDTRVPIGTQEQLLSVSSELEVYWRNITEDAEAIYVALNGVDEDEDGRGSFEKPFRTIRYAADHVEDNFDPLTPVIIRVAAGRYEEIGPISVPAGCAINGDELRSTTIVANPPFESYQNYYQYIVPMLTYLESLFVRLFAGTGVPPQPGNTLQQINLSNFVATDDEPTFPASGVASSQRAADRLDDYKNFIEFRIQSGDVNPTLSGSNELAIAGFRNAARVLRYNKKYLIQDLLMYLKNTYPSVVFNETNIRNDASSIIRGLIYDLTYPGNYGILREARRFTNAVTGSQTDSLFFMRDSTGLRDCTTGGLQGVLQPPQVFELYQRPTGGALVSLDPGWGPDDERVWIVNRSPYIQGVTNTGTGCVGKKVDGSLHNGGTKSMVSNDFTQVLSDGIGVWVSNNARTELVSVFTYYCQIGYFAEDGGVIRATNGNNSYGTYGAIADGADQTETPQTVTVMNRNNEAQVTQAFAGGISDELFAFEYENCGEEYTTASASVIGSGSNASVEYTDFRDGALFEARLTKALGDSGDKGGSGYLTRQGSAQETIGASSTVRLSANDVTLDVSEIEGMRIIITGGTGVGQYGYVDGFNFVTKAVTVRRDSDGELGWDHIIPGTPIEEDLDLTTRYRIEPRITVNHPGFSASSYNLFSNRTFVGLDYGGTTETFTDLDGSTVISWTDDNDDAVTLDNIVSALALQVTGTFAENPTVPFEIVGVTSGTVATVTAVTANVDGILEVDISGGGNSFTLGEEFRINLVAGTGNTFDDDPVAATFSVTRSGTVYNVTLTNAGAGYSVGDTITVLGTLLGGTTPANDLIITITDVTDDSSSSIQSFSTSGVGKDDIFVSLTNAEYAYYSTDGINWTESTLSFIGDYRKLIAANNRFFAIANNENRFSLSLDGENWETQSLPFSASWRDAVYGGGKYVLVADDLNNQVLVSSDGTSWTTAIVPDDVGGDDSTISQWAHIAYGKGRFVAVSENDRAVAVSTNGAVTWTRYDEVLPDLSPADDWDIVSLSYGNNRFLILDSLGRCAYSFNGQTWYQGTDAPGSLTWSRMKYGNGVFFAIGLDSTNPTDSCATTEDGLLWYNRTLASTHRWGMLGLGKISNVNRWVLLANAGTTGAINHVATGAKARCRSDVLQGKFDRIKIWDPGSGYSSTNLPVLTIIDPNAETNITYDSRIGNGVLSQPDFINRGSGYRSSTSTIIISGDGYADIIPEEQVVVLAGVRDLPGPGVQIRFSTIDDLETENDLTDLKVFSGVSITDLGDDGSGNGTRLVSITMSPALRTEYNLVHGTSATLRERYSQCRITGHDFLDIGTGNFEDTNYPDIYAGGRFFTALPENEVYESNGGRVFYTSTDQDGNFRTGELFAVQQSTGIVTISAEFFDLDGLSELALGGVRLGGSGTVVNEFSTDPTFIADSNSIIPTQRAIATFLANRLSVGGENLEVNRLVAGRVGIGGFQKSLENVVGEYLEIPVTVTFDGVYTDADELEHPTAIQGTIISQMMFLKQFDEGMQ